MRTSPRCRRTLALLAVVASAAALGTMPAATARAHSSARAAEPRTTGEVHTVVDPDYRGRGCSTEAQTSANDTYDRTAGHRTGTATVHAEGAFTGASGDEATFEVDSSSTAEITTRGGLDRVDASGSTGYRLDVFSVDNCQSRWARIVNHNTTTIRVSRRTEVMLRWRTSPRYVGESYVYVQKIHTHNYPLSVDPLLDGRRGTATAVLSPGRYKVHSSFSFDGLEYLVDPGEARAWKGSYHYVLKKS